jgi:hypothetical protein
MQLIIDKSNRLNTDISWEWNYIMDIFRAIENIPELNNFDFILTDNLEYIEIKNKENTIVFIVSDERYTIPKYINDVKAIFKNYVSPDQEKLNIYPIPQGYNKNIIHFPKRKIIDRKYEVSFQGNFHTTRAIILDNLFKVLQGKNIKINGLFKQSGGGLEYSENLLNTKISLCLDGQITPENFRFFESTMLGCVVFAGSMLPNNWLYQSKHFIIVDWQNPFDVAEKIINLIDNNDLMQKYSDLSYEAWKEKYSGEAVANYIKNKLT